MWTPLSINCYTESLFYIVMLDLFTDGSTGIEKMQPNVKYIHLGLHVTTPTNLLHSLKRERGGRRAKTLQTETRQRRGTIEYNSCVDIFQLPTLALHNRSSWFLVSLSLFDDVVLLGCAGLSVGCLWLRCDLFIYPVDSSWKLVTVHTLKPRMMLLPFARSFRLRPNQKIEIEPI